MKPNRYIELFDNPGSVLLSGIPVLEYPDFFEFIDLLMREEGTHCVSYFVLPLAGKYRFICCMAADENHAVVLLSHEQPAVAGLSIPSITAAHYQFHIFEREIHENFGIRFDGHPWLKPVRYPSDRANREQVMDNYPFFAIGGEQLHEVGVGPVHAGIIEPGHFRFICNGEQVKHLEIHLGYQHRGVEKLFVEKNRILQQAVLAESIAGDTVIGHALAWAGALETLAGISISGQLATERTVALELERIAMHIGDTAALCNDVAYQLGQVVCEALRTIVINTTQLWCGNRFGKGLIRPGCTYYPLTAAVSEMILANLKEVEERYLQAAGRIFSLPSVLSRFEGTGPVSTMQASLIGAVGMAARSSGMYRDIRWSHPFAAFRDHYYEPAMLQKGDVWSRAMLRKMEVENSMAIIRELLTDKSGAEEMQNAKCKMQNASLRLAPSSLAVSLVEGWRGEICHIAITGDDGKLMQYKVTDPSVHNWMALALSVRNQEISDFPLCNKSFNLSYCGNDL